MQTVHFEEVVEKMVAQDSRYRREAYFFLREALEHTQKSIGKARKGEERHVSGRELLTGIREYALTQYGPMTLMMLEEWGIRSCEDFGELVFNMVDAGLLGKTDTDSRDDFKNGYDFVEVFKKPFLPSSTKPTKQISLPQ
jgi:uncharacterized repeat protein (TIGR04138 family)